MTSPLGALSLVSAASRRLWCQSAAAAAVHWPRTGSASARQLHLSAPNSSQQINFAPIYSCASSSSADPWRQQRRLLTGSRSRYLGPRRDLDTPQHHCATQGASVSPASVFEGSDHLPALPVPRLDGTLQLLRETIWPVAMNSAEFAAALELIEDFERSAGPKLNLLLEQKAKQTKNWLSHDWWVQETYLKSRAPLVLNSNPSMIYPQFPFEVNHQRALVSTLAQLISGVVDFKLALAQGLNPEATSADNEYHLDPSLCYSQYKNIFGSTRRPREHMDELRTPWPMHQTPDTDHKQTDCAGADPSFSLVFAFKGRFFQLQLGQIEDEQSRIETLKRMLEKIISSPHLSAPTNEHNNNQDEFIGCGLLTTRGRDQWASAYRLLDADSLQAIEAAQFLVCLDTICAEPMQSDTTTTSSCGYTSDEPTDLNSNLHFSSRLVAASDERARHSDSYLAALSRQILHGDLHNVGNRWFDKSLQLIVVADERAERLLGAGLNYEHTLAEAAVISKMIEHSYDYTVQRHRANSQTGDKFMTSQSADLALASTTGSSFRQLPMLATDASEQVSQTLADQLTEARQEFASQIGQFDLSLFAHRRYGSNTIKSLGYSPDSWLQVAIQLAFYNLHHRLSPCYESASTRQFAYGRTETIRSLTKDVAEFCQSPSAESMQAAIRSHKAYALAANNAQAIDRVLMGHRLILAELRAGKWSWGLPASLEATSESSSSRNRAALSDIEKVFSQQELKVIGAFFNNQLIERSRRFGLSTSQVSSLHPNICLAYGPMRADGYGCCYNITGQQIVAAITAANSLSQSFSCDVHRFSSSLGEALDQMHEIALAAKQQN